MGSQGMGVRSIDWEFEYRDGGIAMVTNDSIERIYLFLGYDHVCMHLN